MNRYLKIEKYNEDGDLTVEYVEPMDTETIYTVIETELIDSAESGESVTFTVMEMTEEDYFELDARMR